MTGTENGGASGPAPRTHPRHAHRTSTAERYEVRFRISTTARFGAWRSVGLARATTFTTFLRRTTYYVQVRVVNVRGASAAVQVRAVPTT